MGLFLPHADLTPARARRELSLEVDASTGIVRARDLGAYREAEEAVAAARAQAEAIVADARAAYEAERKRGWEEGTARAKREEAQRMAELVNRSDAWLARIEDSLAAAVMQAVRRIVHGYDERDRVLHSLRTALAVVRNQKQLTLRVHPDHVEHVRGHTAQLIADYPGVALLDVVGDGRLEGDACVLESEIGIVEAGSEGQLAALEAALRKARAAAA